MAPFSLVPKRCFWWTTDPQRQGQPTPCPQPAVWRGVFIDRAGRIHYDVDACSEHMAMLRDPTTADKPRG